MSRLRQVLRLYGQGRSKKQISVLTATSRNTVKKYIERFTELHLTLTDINGMDDYGLSQLFTPQEQAPPPDERYLHLQSLLPQIDKELGRKGMTIKKQWEKYIEASPTGYSHAQFYHYYRHYVKRSHPSMHIPHKAGDKMFIDFAGEKLHIADKETGEVTAVEVFVAILGCSQLTYVEAVASQKKEDLIKACENALHYFDGVPAAIVPDNLRAAVTKSNRYEPIINETFEDFANHYATAVLPARAYRPKDKALVEGAVKLIYRSIYTTVNEQAYTSLHELNTAVAQALECHNNTPFKGRGYSRRAQFEEVERTSLQPLPAYRYELRLSSMATVMKNGHVCLSMDKHYYSVPYRFIGKKVKLLYNSIQVELFYKYERIALHQRSYRKYTYTTNSEHLASAHRFLSDWTPEKFIEEAAAIHEDVATYIIQVMELKAHPEQAYKSCSGILQLKRKAGTERLINACRRANSYGVYNYPIIVQILEKNLDRLSEEERDTIEQAQMPEHHNIRGKQYYQ